MTQYEAFSVLVLLQGTIFYRATTESSAYLPDSDPNILATLGTFCRHVSEFDYGA